ncbi:hypothetical protein PybrP1_008515 [[Pythium] brassicae (nom. inval.)]|nr:hypothetical protein PybrP1_008515 [[Pythium] brassicae (nom. inval.)]
MVVATESSPLFRESLVLQQIESRRRRSSRARLLAIACVVAALGLVAGLLFWPSSSSPHSPLVEKSTARHSSAFEGDTDNSEQGAVRHVRVFYREANGPVNIEFSEKETPLNGADAAATFNDSLHAIGWSQLWIATAALTPHELQDAALSRRRRLETMFAAGYAEAALTHQRIDEHFMNVYLTFFRNGDAADEEALRGLRAFLRENLDWMRAQVERFSALPDHLDARYWEAIGLILAQFDGLVHGYQRFSQRQPPVSAIDLFMLNADGDLQDLLPVIQRRQRPAHVSPAAAAITQSFYTFLKTLKCSALIRILPDFADLVWGHATWDTYSSMNRIYKHYEVPVPPATSGGGDARRKISMSSSPGYLSSVDDWYMTDAGLGVMETTHGVFDDALYTFVTPQSVLCWLRSKAANVLGEDGMSWAATFSKFNSGTYNDQWMVIDTKHFVPGEGFRRNGLTVLEQLPGFIHVEDVSLVVNARGYWGSYNVPYFPSVYDRSGFHAAYIATNRSASWSHANCTRAKIFERDAPRVRSFEDLKRLMRYNNWRADPLSSAHASHAVASRYDLEADPALFALDGAIDAKATSWSRMQRGRLESDAVSGPTHDHNPVFEWTDALGALAPHCGQPPRFDFSYETMGHGRA